MSDVTRILSQIEHSDSKAAAQLLPLAYALPVLLCPLFLAGATTGAWAQTGSRSGRGAC